MTQSALVDTASDADSNAITPMEDQLVDSHPVSWIHGNTSDFRYLLTKVVSALEFQKEEVRMSAFAGTAESTFVSLSSMEIRSMFAVV